MSVALLKREDSEALSKVDAASRALAEVRDIWSAKRAVEYAKLLKQYVRAIECSEEIAANAHALVIEAHRTFGEYWRDAEKNEGTRGQLVGPSEIGGVASTQPTLAHLGVDRHVAAESVKLADLADRHPDIYESLKSREINKAKALAALKPPKPAPNPFHLLVESGRLRDAIDRLIERWPANQQKHIPSILRDIADEMEAA